MPKDIVRTIFTTLIFLVALVSMACVESGSALSSSQSRNSSASTPPANVMAVEEKIERLRRLVPSKPTVIADAEVVRVMIEAGETKRPEVLNLLIDSLAFNYDPENRNEYDDQASMIPAIAIIKQNFGDRSTETLFGVGISTDKDWLSERIALTIRINLPSEATEALAKRASSQSQDDRSKYFSLALSKRDLKVKLASRRDGLDEIDESLKTKQKPRT